MVKDIILTLGLLCVPVSAFADEAALNAEASAALAFLQKSDADANDPYCQTAIDKNGNGVYDPGEPIGNYTNNWRIHSANEVICVDIKCNKETGNCCQKKEYGFFGYKVYACECPKASADIE